MNYVLGLDAGGTKTLLALADRTGQVAALVHGPGLDPLQAPNWPAHLADMLDQLPDLGMVQAAVLGLPMHGEAPSISQNQVREARALLPIVPIIDNDVRIAFDGAFAGAGGVLILAGTGSMAWASLGGPDDFHVRAGGWGEAFGDEGSAFWIGRESLARLGRELDGRDDRTGFAQGMLDGMGIDAADVASWCYGLTERRRAFAALATITSRLAADGVPAARVILERAGDELAETMLAAWRRAAGPAPLRWSYAGGVTNDAVVMARIEERVGTAPLPRRLPPVGGALYRAAVHLGWDVGGDWVETLNRALGRFPAPLQHAQKQETRG